MKAYVIAETEILDRALAERYRELAQKSIAKYDGRYIVRGGAVDAIEGSWHPTLVDESSTPMRSACVNCRPSHAS